MIARFRGGFGTPRRAVFVLAAVLLAGLTAAGATPPAAATLHRLIDFETPGYGAPGRRLTDHFVMEVAGTWHLFYTELPSPTSSECRIGHATSADLIHWTERPTVVTALGSGAFATGTWAPHAVPRIGGGWILYYTGRNEAGAQSICASTSTDLDTWTAVSPEPVWTPATAPWAQWNPGLISSCRDPFVWQDGVQWRMIYTAIDVAGRHAIGRARSTDQLNWVDDGPFAIDSTSSSPIDLESPTLVFDNGRVELLYSRYWARFLSAASVSGPWDVGGGTTLDDRAVAPEKAKVGTTQILTRLRYDDCQALPTGIIVIDTVTATPGGYAIPAMPGVPFGWRQDGDAFATGPAYGDRPAHRGDVPAQPQGLRWAASGETVGMPGDTNEPCDGPSRDSQVGWLRSPRFTLLGDSLWFRVMGADSPDSAHVRLLDACTGLELARRTGPNTTALVPAAWSNAGRRGWPVEIELVDRLERPGGVIGADQFRDSTIGTFTAPTPVAINQTAPAGGENLAPGTTYVIRWTSFHSAGVDSHVVYVSYDDFATPPLRLQRRNGNQFSWGWTVPPGPHFDARIRVVAFAKNGVHDCDTSPPFTIAVTADAPAPVPGEGLDLRAHGSPGPTPTLEWSAPAGTRAWLRLYDVRGRLVRTLVAGETAPDPGPRRVTWDGRDRSGRPAPAGVHFALLTGEGGSRRRVSLVRLGP
jgi:hypothetical protein